MTTPLGGRVTVETINSEPQLRERLHKGDVIVLQTLTNGGEVQSHAEYVPPGGRDDLPIESILGEVDKKVNRVKPFNIIEIEWE